MKGDGEPIKRLSRAIHDSRGKSTSSSMSLKLSPMSLMQNQETSRKDLRH